MENKYLVLLGIAFVCLAFAGCTSGNGPSGGESGPMGEPGNWTGEMPEGEMPEGMMGGGMPGGEGGMMQEDMMEQAAACEGKSEGDSCTFEGGMEGETNATCTMQEETLICMPEMIEGGPGGGMAPPQ